MSRGRRSGRCASSEAGRQLCSIRACANRRALPADEGRTSLCPSLSDRGIDRAPRPYVQPSRRLTPCLSAQALTRLAQETFSAASSLPERFLAAYVSSGQATRNYSSSASDNQPGIVIVGKISRTLEMIKRGGSTSAASTLPGGIRRPRPLPRSQSAHPRKALGQAGVGQP